MAEARVDDLLSVLALVDPLHRAVTRAATDDLADHGVGPGARTVLERLAQDGPATVPQLGRALALPRQAIQRMVDDLLTRRLVEPRADPGHRRSHLVAVSGPGRELLDAVRTGERVRLGAVAERFTASQTAAAMDVLTALTQHLAALTQQPTEPALQRTGPVKQPGEPRSHGRSDPPATDALVVAPVSSAGVVRRPAGDPRCGSGGRRSS